MAISILVVDDEPSQRSALAGFLRKKGYVTVEAESAAAALTVARQQVVDLVLTDLRMPGMDGARLLQELKSLNPLLDVIIMTAFGTMSEAVGAMKEGALDFITKPIDLEQLEVAIARAVERKQLISENQRLQQLVEERSSFSGILTRSESMQRALSVAARAAASRPATRASSARRSPAR